MISAISEKQQLYVDMLDRACVSYRDAVQADDRFVKYLLEILIRTLSDEIPKDWEDAKQLKATVIEVLSTRH